MLNLSPSPHDFTYTTNAIQSSLCVYVGIFLIRRYCWRSCCCDFCIRIRWHTRNFPDFLAVFVDVPIHFPLWRLKRTPNFPLAFFYFVVVVFVYHTFVFFLSLFWKSFTPCNSKVLVMFQRMFFSSSSIQQWFAFAMLSRKYVFVSLELEYCFADVSSIISRRLEPGKRLFFFNGKARERDK